MLQNGNEIKCYFIMFQLHSVINLSIVQSFKGRIKTTCRSKVLPRARIWPPTMPITTWQAGVVFSSQTAEETRLLVPIY